MKEGYNEELLSDLWYRRDKLNKAEWGLLYECVYKRLSVFNFHLYPHILAVETEDDLINGFFLKKVLLPARKTQYRAKGLVSCNALVGFFKNYLIDVARPLQTSRVQGLEPVPLGTGTTNTTTAAKGDYKAAYESIIPADIEQAKQAVNPFLNVGVSEKFIAQEASRFITQSEEWVRIFLCCNFCCESGSTVALVTLAKRHAISAYDYKARKLGITYIKQGFNSPEEFGETLLGQWIEAVGIPIVIDNKEAVDEALKILCLQALIYKTTSKKDQPDWCYDE